jgi:phenylacetic acid degradation operon negative regulatory protein
VTARSALLDLYGDHLAARGGRAPVAALVRLLAPLGVAAPAVRTAVSRMVRQGWLTPVRLPDGPGYQLTPAAVRRLEDAAARAYRSGPNGTWDGRWHLLVLPRQPDRSRRERVRHGLAFLGYAPLDDCTWLAPRPAAGLGPLLASEGLCAERFSVLHEGDTAALVRRLWDLDGLARAYAAWLDEAKVLVGELGPAWTDEQAFAVRSRLVHGWRTFLFRDPGLPPDLLPPDWPGGGAAAFLDAESGRLWPAARRFVDRCLSAPPPPELADESGECR